MTTKGSASASPSKARLGFAAGLLLHLVAVATAEYVQDAHTTYCWTIAQPANATTISETLRVQGDTACPLQVRLQLNASVVHPLNAVRATWEVSTSDTNAQQVQIVQAQVHACSANTLCDPFTSSSVGISASTNSSQAANLTNGKAIFTDVLTFPIATKYSIFAHVVVPGNDRSWRADFAVFTTLTVQPDIAAANTNQQDTTETPVKASATTRHSSFSQTAAIAIIVGMVAVTTILVMRSVVFRGARGADMTIVMPAFTSRCSADEYRDTYPEDSEACIWSACMFQPVLDLGGDSSEDSSDLTFDNSMGVDSTQSSEEARRHRAPARYFVDLPPVSIQFEDLLEAAMNDEEDFTLPSRSTCPSFIVSSEGTATTSTTYDLNLLTLTKSAPASQMRYLNL